MPTTPEVAQVVPIGYLLIAITGLVTALAVVFWQMIAAKNETIALAKEVIPVATTLSAVAANLQRMLERHDDWRPGGPPP